MKKILISALVIFNLVFSGMHFYAGIEAEGSMDVRDRIGNPDFNILSMNSLTFVDENGNETSTPTIGSRAKFSIDLSLLDATVLHGIQPGDYFKVVLPDTFRVPTESKNNALLDETETVKWGTLDLLTNRELIIYFTEELFELTNLSAHIEFELRLNESVIDSPGRHEFEVPFVKDQKFSFDLKPTGAMTSIEKSGKPNKEMNASEILWEVQINKKYDTLHNAVVTDALDSKLELIDVIVLPLNLNTKGEVVGYGDPLPQSEYTVNGTTVSLGDINVPYAVRYNTKIKGESIPVLGDAQLEFPNKALLNSDEVTDMESSITVKTSYGKLLNKVKPSYDASTQTFTWTVEYNYNEGTFVNPLLVDTFDSRLNFVEGSFVVKTKAGAVVSKDVTTSVSNGNVLNIQFNETVNEALQLVYQTKVKDGVIITGVDSTIESFDNKIEIKDVVSSGSSGNATQQIVRKAVTGTNYIAKTIDWKIDINRNKYELQSYVLSDSFTPEGLSMKPETFKIMDGSTQLQAGIDYDLSLTHNASGNESGFQVIFKGNYATTRSHLVVTYVTDYDTKILRGHVSNQFENTATVDWTDSNGTGHKDSDVARSNLNNYAIKNGMKTGSYNAVTKEITWSVYFNYNAESYADITLTDAILGDQKFIDSSLEIRKYTVDEGGSIVTQGLESHTQFQIDKPNAANQQTLSIGFPGNNQDRYVVTYRTSLADQEIMKKYDNEAVITADSFSDSLDASVTIANGGKIVSKTGKQNGDLINWSIAINEGQSTIRNAVLEDLPSNNQFILDDTIKLYPVTMNVDGSYSVNRNQALQRGVDYKVEMLKDSDDNGFFRITFLFEITRAYVLEYDAQISITQSNPQITNKVSLSGNEVRYVDDGGDSAVVVDVTRVSVSAMGERSAYTLKKVNAQGEPLEGVQFELYNVNNRKLMTVTTDAEGKATFKNILLGDYTIREIQTLPGYVIRDELATGHRIKVTADTSKADTFEVIENDTSKLTLRKVNTAGALVPGATFKLEYLNGDAWTVVVDVLALDSGTVTLEGQPSGKYRLTELSTPEGYVLNTAPLEFDIVRNWNNQVVDKTVNFTNYKGSLVLEKKDEQGNVLNGVTFSLYTEDDRLLRSGITTANNGRLTVDNLAPGKYYLVETQSAMGNIVNTTPLPFTIVGSASGVPTPAFISTTNAKGIIQLNKVDANNNPLKDVIFNLYKTEGEVETLIGTSASDEAGVVLFDGVEPGNYSIREVETVAGYILNTSPVTVTMPTSAAVQKVTVQAGTVVNYKGSVVLQKKDVYQNFVSGSVFNIERYETDTWVSFMDDLELTNGSITLENVVPGTYRMVETIASSEFLLNTNPVEFVVGASAAGIPDAVTVSFTNFKGALKVTKVGADNEVLENVVFDLFNAQNVRIRTDLSTDVDGIVEVIDLAPGDYTLVEKQSSNGYIANTTPIHFTIIDSASDAPGVVELTVTNAKGSVVLRKVDAQGQGLEGTYFNVFKEDGTEIASLYSGEDGMMRIDGLDVGVYYFQEAIALPGYILNTEKHFFEIDATADTAEVVVDAQEFVNYKGKIEIEKVDPKGNRLSGAHFNVFDARGTLVAELVTVDGSAYIEDLEPGTYTVVETTAPVGYVLNQEIQTVTIGAQQEGKVLPVVVRVVNHPIPQSPLLPNTGDVSGGMIIWGATNTILGLGLLMISKRKQKENKKGSF